MSSKSNHSSTVEKQNGGQNQENQNVQPAAAAQAQENHNVQPAQAQANNEGEEKKLPQTVPEEEQIETIPAVEVVLEENQLESSSVAGSKESKTMLLGPRLAEDANLLVPLEENQLHSSSDVLGLLHSSSDELRLPMGYWFRPQDDELIVDYLIPIILGTEPPANVIREFDVFEFDPDILFESEFKYIPKGEVYFVSKLQFDMGAEITASRPAKNGFWEVNGEAAEVRNKSEEIVGYKETLIFYRRTETTLEKTNWTMYEYRVSPNMMIPDADKYIACRIKYKDGSEKKGEEQSDRSSSSSGEEDGIINVRLKLTLTRRNTCRS